ncbi:hypothetical protein [Bacteroides sp. 519]|uniref:hypothetical protein n=1 Tax=Bacteroides sp. 519 TaxID=2302937 RepID=UPI0013D75BF8|nr:hypothetical protein [Bacteroides sp. 519]
MEKKKIPAIFKEDLQNFLQSVNELDKIEQSERFCLLCSKLISLKNIQLIIPRKGDSYDYVCDSPTCVEEYNHNQ